MSYVCILLDYVVNRDGDMGLMENLQGATFDSISFIIDFI